MKRIGYILTLVVLLGSACSDYLQEDNKSSITTDEYYNTQTGYETLVNASYSTLRELYTDMNSEDDNVTNLTSFQQLSMLGTDLFCVAKLADQNDIVDGYFQLTPDNAAAETLFSNCYKAIQMHNLALDWAERTEAFEALPRRVAEVRFIRAYMYHILVEMYGGVSIVTEAFNEPITTFERDSEEDVYEFIISELEAIKTVLPVSAEMEGRVSKGAIEHLLSLVYLSRGYTSFAAADDFQKATENATNVIESGEYALLNSFEDVFRPGNENNQEIIFSIQYDAGSLLNGVAGNSIHAWGGLNSTQTAGMPYRHGQMRPTDRAFLQYDSTDVRFEGSFMLTQYDPYYDFYDDSKDEADKTILHFYPHTSVVEDPLNPGPANYIYGDSYSVFVAEGEEWEDTLYPWVRKFDDPNSVTRTDNSRDIFVFRLAETYLIRAEAKIMQGQSGDDDINAVRSRSWDELTVGATMDTLLDERGRELMGEGKRWMDLRRAGKIKERASLYNPSVRNYINQGVSPFGDQDGKAQRRPIPTNVIIRDENGYGQNVGY